MSTSSSPSPSSAPAFENKSTCSKCNTSFNLFTRKHHCRQCGRTFCDRCSSWNIPLPHFGFTQPVRVDEKCYQSIQQQQQQQQQKPKANNTTTTSTETSTSVPNPNPNPAPVPVPVPAPAPAPVRVRACTCNMPLCICPPDEPSSADEKQNASSSQSLKQSQSQSQSATKDKPVSRPAATTKTPTTTSSFSGFVGFPSLSSVANPNSNSNSNSTSTNSNSLTSYDLHGDLNEQCREAIKQGDTKGTQYLLKAGAKPNYIDRTGNTLLHLACMFDRWDTVCMFLSAGGDVTCRNPSGETPLDLAPPALQHKIKMWQQHNNTSTTRPNPDKQ